MKTILTTLLTSISLILNAQEVFKLNETYPINLSGTIYLDSDDAKVTITGSNRSDVHVNIYRKIETKGFTFSTQDFEVDVNPRGGNLYIEEHVSGNLSIMGYSEEEYTIEIEAPLGASLTIDGDDDDYKITNINGAIDMDIDDGDVYLKNCKGDNFKFDVDDGDIVMDTGAGKLYAKLDDGNIDVTNAGFEEIEVSNDDGNINISTSLSNNGKYFFKSDDSDIEFNIVRGGGKFIISHDDARIRASDKFTMEYQEENETRLTLAKGTAEVRIRTDDARVNLTSN